HLLSAGAGIGGPDVAPKCVNDDCSRGYEERQSIWSYNSVNGNSTGGGIRVQGVLPIAFAVESSELGYDSVGKKGGYTPQEIVHFADTYLKATHLFWVRNDATGTSRQKWHGGILPVIEATKLKNSDCPSIYDTCVSD